MKQIRLNVNIFFSVPDDYVVTDMESIEFKGDVELWGGKADETHEVIAGRVAYHETIETVDENDLGGF